MFAGLFIAVAVFSSHVPACRAFVGPMMSVQNAPAGLSRREFAQGAVAVALSAAALPAVAASVPVAGASAPDFKLPSNAGKDISLSDLTSSGKRTVLYFYPGDFTSGCTIEARGFQKDIQKYTALNAQIVGVSVDPVDKHVDFVKKCGLDFLLLSDQGGAVADKYGTKLELPFLGKFANRQTYIISPKGTIEKVFTDVESRVSKHSAEVLQALEQLKA